MVFVVFWLLAQWSRVWFPAWERDFSLSQNVHTGYWPTQPPFSACWECLLKEKSDQSGQDVNFYNPTPSSAKVKNEWSYTSSPPPHVPSWYVQRQHCYFLSSDPLYQWHNQQFCSRGGGFNKFSWGQRERGSGGSSPLVRGSGGSCNLVQEIPFHIVKFSSFLAL